MSFVPRTVIVSLALVAAAGLYRPQALAAQSHGDLAIVVNPETPATKLSFAELRQVFLGDKQYWIAKIFRAELSSPPKIVYSTESTLSLISSIPGAIAFMAAGDVKPGLKVVRIDDHLPGEAGYRLHLSGK